ncbi:hypothetical protein A1507_06895 [Methylomonas koyamae]|uniref:Tetratricopeptide repeat protein n=1 Tax=Methylomonas koyamae TaxID=702114 RepID=A0A177NN60_9GAMM|nr:tetratricopeptide repeat protein [Methylomonas koyamae]OAI19508.1 hypothetical protein A1507_06895 [Methylomonas koyamae]
MQLIEIGRNQWMFQDKELPQLTYQEFDAAWDYWDQGDYMHAEKLLRRLIEYNPSHIDAWNLLSLIFEETSRELEAYLCCREAVRTGLDVIPKKFNWKTASLEWGFLENRPFMRAYHNLGLWHERRNEPQLAIEVYSRLLAVCPNDNLGVRLILPKLWLETGDLLSVIRHCKSLADEFSPEILYTYPLALILSGEHAKAEPLIEIAKREFPLVAKELMKKRHTRPKSMMPGHITHGGADQAYEYWVEYGKFWAHSEEAMALLSR